MPRQIAAPAATAMIPSFVNGAIGSRIPDNHVWSQALAEDPVTSLLLEIVSNPAMAQSQQVVQKLDYIYRQPARLGQFSVKDKILYMREFFQNDDRYVELKIVPTSLRNIIFVAFHSNPIGGHLNAFRTYHRIRQRFFGQECTNISKECVTHALAAAFPILQKTDLLIWFTASQLRHQ